MATLEPADVDFIDRAPLRIDSELTLRQPPDQVWQVLVDNERWPEWFGSCKAARTTSEPGSGVGASRWAHVDLFKVDERFIVWDEPTRWGFTIERANLPIADTVVELIELEPSDRGTHLTYTFAIALKPWLRPLTPLMRWRFRQLFRSSLRGLQPYLDRRSASARPSQNDR